MGFLPNWIEQARLKKGKEEKVLSLSQLLNLPDYLF